MQLKLIRFLHFNLFVVFFFLSFYSFIYCTMYILNETATTGIKLNHQFKKRKKKWRKKKEIKKKLKLKMPYKKVIFSSWGIKWTRVRRTFFFVYLFGSVSFRFVSLLISILLCVCVCVCVGCPCSYIVHSSFYFHDKSLLVIFFWFYFIRTKSTDFKIDESHR